MKRKFATALAWYLVFFAAFGLSAIRFGMTNHGSSGCILNVVSGGACAAQEDALDGILTHVVALKKLMTGVLNDRSFPESDPGLAVRLSAAAFGLAAVWSFSRFRPLPAFSVIRKGKFRRWLALHEKRDPEMLR